jgi:hypothetical protein
MRIRSYAVEEVKNDYLQKNDQNGDNYSKSK